ncbi:MAG: DinB family protein [Candidatus Eisenbacteria bacterium]
MNSEKREQLIRQYAAGYDEVAQALKAFPEESLSAHPIPGKWSAREIVHHLADSESISAQRLRKLLSEEFPVIYGYDQEKFAILLRYNVREITPALDAFRAARATTMQLIETMTEEDWKLKGWHNEHGTYTADFWLEVYSVHAHNHAAQIRQLREALK